jgi:hypothetical protein
MRAEVCRMDLRNLYSELEGLTAQAGEVRDLAAENMPVATKNAAAQLYEEMVELLRRIEDEQSEDAA